VSFGVVDLAPRAPGPKDDDILPGAGARHYVFDEWGVRVWRITGMGVGSDRCSY